MAANWRSQVKESDALFEILYSRHLGIAGFLRRAPATGPLCCLPGVICELGIRRFSERLDIRVHGDVAFRQAICREFPELPKRLSSLTHRLIDDMVRSGIADDKSGRDGEEWEAEAEA